MAVKTDISWAHATWNPWVGCFKVSPGCKACYMYRDQKRYGNDPKAIRRTKGAFTNPIKWANAGKLSAGSRIFTCSWSDWFLVEADRWRDEAWEVVRSTPQYIYLILTKRPELIEERLPKNWLTQFNHVWLGVSVESQEYRFRADILKDIPAAKRFISYEPALGPVNWDLDGIDWVISGGESDKNPRRADLNWFRATRDQCKKEGVAYFHKQHGGSRKIDGAWGGVKLDGVIHHEFPGD